MSSKRSKRMVDLAINKNVRYRTSKQKNHILSDTSKEKCIQERPESLLPPGAVNIHKEMHDIWQEVFGDTHDMQLVSETSVCSTSEEISGTPTLGNRQLDACRDSAAPLDTMTFDDQDLDVSRSSAAHLYAPMLDCQELEVSPASSVPHQTPIPENEELNISASAAAPLDRVANGNRKLDDCTATAVPHPIPTGDNQEIDVSTGSAAYKETQKLDIQEFNVICPSPNKTPLPSPVNKHRKCSDPFCCQHDADDYDSCPSVNTQTDSPVFRCRGRKRLRHCDEWGDIKRKKLTNLGKIYSSKRGKLVNEKEMKPPCSCKFKCSKKISETERLEMFKTFWALGDRERQWLHIVNYSTKLTKSRTLTREIKNNRRFTYKYFLPKEGEPSAAANKLDVCKTMFLNTYSISDRLVRTAWEKYDGSTTVEKDMRGKHSNHKKVIDEAMVQSVCAHVRSFVPVESHYIRKSSKRLYLDGTLSIAKMFNMYKEWDELQHYDNKAFSLRQYRDIVNSRFNLSFHIPKKDTCDQCHIYKNKETPSEQDKEAQAIHQENKKIARNLKAKDKQDALDSNEIIVCATFDFQKVLTCPHNEMSILYYKRKLSCYNFTVYNCASRNANCYMWDEGVAKRGANEVSSCLYHFIKTQVQKGAKEFRFWSDNCAGQNRNRIVFSMYQHAAKEFGITITHRFLEKGHTQNEGDNVHSVIERSSEHKEITTPEEWKLHVRWARTEDREKYTVIDVTQEMVYDYKQLLQNKNWVKNTNNVKVSWLQIREVNVKKTNPNELNYRYNLSNEVSNTIVIRNFTRKNNVASTLKPAYTGPIPISEEKYKDRMSLCATEAIDIKYHNWFKALAHGRTVEPDSD